MERYKQIQSPTYKNRSVRMLMDFWGKLVSNDIKFLLDGVSNLIHFLFQTIKAAMLERKENYCLRQTCMSIILNLLPQLCSYQPTFSYMFFLTWKIHFKVVILFATILRMLSWCSNTCTHFLLFLVTHLKIK